MAWTKQGGTLSVINANSDNTTQLSQVQSIIDRESAAGILTVTRGRLRLRAPGDDGAESGHRISGTDAGDPHRERTSTSCIRITRRVISPA